MPAIVLWARAGRGAVTMQRIDKKRDAARWDLLMTPPEGSRSETDNTAEIAGYPRIRRLVKIIRTSKFSFTVRQVTQGERRGTIQIQPAPAASRAAAPALADNDPSPARRRLSPRGHVRCCSARRGNLDRTRARDQAHRSLHQGDSAASGRCQDCSAGRRWPD